MWFAYVFACEHVQVLIFTYIFMYGNRFKKNQRHEKKQKMKIQKKRKKTIIQKTEKKKNNQRIKTTTKIPSNIKKTRPGSWSGVPRDACYPAADLDAAPPSRTHR